MKKNLIEKIKENGNYHTQLDEIIQKENIEQVAFLNNNKLSNHHCCVQEEHVRFILSKYGIDTKKVFLNSITELFLKEKSILKNQTIQVSDLINNNTKIVIQKTDFVRDNKILKPLLEIEDLSEINKNEKCTIKKFVYDEYMLNNKLNEFIVYDSEYDDMRYYLFGLLHYVNSDHKLLYKYFRYVDIVEYTMDILKIQKFANILSNISSVDDNYFFGYTEDNKSNKFTVSDASTEEYSLKIVTQDISVLYGFIEDYIMIALIKYIKNNNVHLEIVYLNNNYLITLNNNFVTIEEELINSFIHALVEIKENYNLIFKSKAALYKIKDDYLKDSKDEFYKNSEIILYKLKNKNKNNFF